MTHITRTNYSPNINTEKREKKPQHFVVKIDEPIPKEIFEKVREGEATLEFEDED